MIKTLKCLARRFFLVVLLVWFSSASFSHAAPVCGSIITPDTTTEISDCNNPFGATTDPSPFTLKINEEIVVSESEVIIPATGTFDYVVESNRRMAGSLQSFYLHDGDDYRLVDTTPSTPVEADYRRLAADFFAADIDSEPYIQYMLHSADGYNTDSLDLVLLNDFIDYVEQKFVSVVPLLMPGKYTLASEEIILFLTQQNQSKSFWQQLLTLFIPTAHAQSFPPNPIYTLTFTLVAKEPEPTGASSVLFLPGIQASRLYQDGILGTEDQIWPPNALFNNDVNDLMMNTTGVSENAIYTRDVIDTSSGVGSVYGGFEAFLNQLQFDHIIDNWTPYAYDWRYSVADIAENGTLYEEGVRKATDEIEYLASGSYSGKVTIIGHSNGGLLAKAIMLKLEAEGKSNLVDKVIFIASPQLGTPKALGTIMHGYDQSDSYGGLIIDAKITRKVINNLPGAYGLLPAQKYFEGLTEPLITFTNTTSTLDYRNIYGSIISTYSEAVSFIRGEDGLDRDLNNLPNKPARANSIMLNDALAMHDNKLDNWVAPAWVEVIEIVGTGLPTMKSIEYREIVENKCVSAGPAGIICTPEADIKPYAQLTHYGDGTVVQRSAEAYEGEKKKYFVNLQDLNKGYEKQNIHSVFHHSITESTELQELLASLLISTTTQNNQYISTNHTVFNDQYDVEIIDSPIRLLATDTQGKQTGIIIVDGVRTIKQDIPGSQYFEFGDTKYFIVPKGTNRTTKLYGEADGGYTLTMSAFGANDTQVIQKVLKNATVTPDFIAEYSNSNSQYSNITTDLDGDGIIDVVTSLTGTVIPSAYYPILIAKIQSLTLSKLPKQALLLLIKGAQVFSNKTTEKTENKRRERKLLQVAEEIIKLYLKKGYITETIGQELLQIISILKNK